MSEYKPHITEKKKQEIAEIKKLCSEYKVTGIVNLENLPAFNYMKIKSQLRGKVVIKYSKKRLFKLAFDGIEDPKIKELKEKLIGIPALIFANEDPFILFQTLKKSKSAAPAKQGDIAPKDIVIPAGPTDFTPGPMIGELGAIGIKTQVENGKITIKADKTIVKEGEQISEKFSGLMSKLGMEPMEIGLNLVLTYQNGEVLERSVLDIDTDKYFADIKQAASNAIAVSIEVGYVSEDNIELLIKKATLEAKHLFDLSPTGETQEPKEETQKAPAEQPKTEEKKEESKEQKVDTNYDQTKFSDEMVQKAGDILKQLTDKKIKGENK